MEELQIKDILAIAEAELDNIKVSLQKYPTEYGLIDKLIKLYIVIPNIFIKDYPREKIPIIQMFWTCYRGFLISIQLALQGHITESYAITSKSAEAIALAQKFNLHLNKIEAWVKRNKKEDQPFRRMFKNLFPKNDRVVQPNIFEIYDLTSEYGRHPNFSSTAFYSHFDKMNSEGTVLFSFNDLDDETNFHRNLNYIIYAYHKFLEAFSKILRDYLTKEWIKELDDFDAAFRQHKETLKEEFGYKLT